MFNFFKSSEEKRQEQIAAYIDQQMSQRERSQFEAQLQNDADLREQVDAQREVKALLSQMPSLRAPRNFVLNPAVYGGKAPAPSFLESLYPKMRMATAAVSFLFVLALGAGIFLNGGANLAQQAPVAIQSEESIAAAPEPVMLEETIVIEEVVVVEEVVVEEVEVVTEVEAERAVEVEKTMVAEQEAPQVAADEAAPQAESQTEVAEESAEMSNFDDTLAEEDTMADEADMAEEAMMADDAEAGATPPEAEGESAADIVPSPRDIDVEPPEGEKLSEPPTPAPTQTLAPTPSAAPTALSSQDNQEIASRTETEVVIDEDISPEYVGNQPASPNWPAIAVWALGILTILLIASTFVIRRQID